jgi:putative ABC transport system permease protein
VRKQQVLRAVLGEGLSLVLVGIAGGLGVAVIVQRAIASLLYGVQPVDLLTLSVTGIVLLVTGAVACALPAWRAAGIEPIEALRDE